MTIKLVISDVDGTLTDGRVWQGYAMAPACAYSRRDGQAIEDMRSIGVRVEWVSLSTAHTERAATLGVTLHAQHRPPQTESGLVVAESRLDAVKRIAAAAGVDLSEVCYVGDSWTDVEALEAVFRAGGVAVVPWDSEAWHALGTPGLQVDEGGGMFLRSDCRGGEGVLADVRDALFDGPWRRRA